MAGRFAVNISEATLKARSTDPDDAAKLTTSPPISIGIEKRHWLDFQYSRGLVVQRSLLEFIVFNRTSISCMTFPTVSKSAWKSLEAASNGLRMAIISFNKMSW